MGVRNNYYLSSFFWSTLQKILSAILGFISVPLLLGFYGKADYGILSIATACNGYMHLLDLGMNTGAIKFFSQWRTEGKDELINRVARTNISFYLVVSIINSIGLIALAFFGEPLFSVTHAQFQQLQICLYIIALLSSFSWVTTAFNQILIAEKQMSFTMQVQCIQTILKTCLIFVVLWAELSLTMYFFCLNVIISLLIIPYAYKCKAAGFIDTFKPATYWNDFRVVLMFSISIFALSLFQMSATQTRPIILGMFALDGAGSVAEFRIIEVVPQLIIAIGGTFSSIFLPKTSEMVAKGQKLEMTEFCYKWTNRTSIIVSAISIPFVLCSAEVLAAYVGEEYSYLSTWLVVWCYTVLIQMHTTPGNALVLAYGRTKELVISTAVFCVISMIVNALLCKYIGVGSAVVAYFIYVLLVIGLYYIYYYKKLLGLSRYRMMLCFLKPVLLGVVLMYIVKYIPFDFVISDNQNYRISLLLVCMIKSSIWLTLYICLVHLFKIEDIRNIIKK